MKKILLCSLSVILSHLVLMVQSLFHFMGATCKCSECGLYCHLNIHICILYSSGVIISNFMPYCFTEEITAAFRRFGPLIVDWPHKAESKSYFPPKGRADKMYRHHPVRVTLLLEKYVWLILLSHLNCKFLYSTSYSAIFMIILFFFIGFWCSVYSLFHDTGYLFAWFLKIYFLILVVYYKLVIYLIFCMLLKYEIKICNLVCLELCKSPLDCFCTNQLYYHIILPIYYFQHQSHCLLSSFIHHTCPKSFAYHFRHCLNFAACI